MSRDPAPLTPQRVWLRWCDGLSTAEMARRTGRPEHECEATLARCIEGLHAGYLQRMIFGER